MMERSISRARRPDDAELLRRARHDADAFCAFYVRHAPALWHWFHTRTGDAEAASDLVAETFARAFEAVTRFRGARPESAPAWLYGIATNLFRGWLRTRRVERNARERLAMPARSYLAPEIAADAIDRVDADRAADALRAGLRELPENQRLALDLRVLGDRGYAEIAAVVGCTQPAARKRVSRALRTLNDALKGDRR